MAGVPASRSAPGWDSRRGNATFAVPSCPAMPARARPRRAPPLPIIQFRVRPGHVELGRTEVVLEPRGVPAGQVEKPLAAGLTPREIDVLRLVARGLTDAEVGAMPRHQHTHGQRTTSLDLRQDRRAVTHHCGALRGDQRPGQLNRCDRRRQRRAPRPSARVPDWQVPTRQPLGRKLLRGRALPGDLDRHPSKGQILAQ